MKQLTFFLLSSFFINCFGQQYSKIWTDIDYAGDGKIGHLLDIYLPITNRQTVPVVIYIYGFGWLSNNSKGTDISTVGSALLNAVYAVVMPNYRASTDSIFPAQIHDIKAAIRFIRANASKYQFDASFIGLSGRSAGGHLSALAGTSSDVKQYTVDFTTIDIEGNVGKYKTYSSKVNAVCDFFGPTDFSKMDSCGGSLSSAYYYASLLIGGKIQDNKSKCALANPLTYIDPTDPPFLIIHGDADTVVPLCESKLLYKALQDKGVGCQLEIVPGGEHGPGVIVDTYINKMVSFFNNVKSAVTLIKEPINDPVKVTFNSDNNTINVRSSSGVSIMNYEIFDLSGKVIIKNYFKNNSIGIGFLNQGIYILKIQTKEGNCYIRKFPKL